MVVNIFATLGKAKVEGRVLKKISVIIPTFNCERFIESAIESAQAQIGVELDIIVIDDGSLDKTKDIVTRLVQKYSNIRYVENIFNKGAAGARNTGIFLSNECDYFAFLDADDRWEEDKLYKQTKLMEKTASKLSEWMETNIPEGFAVFILPENQRKKLRSTNMVERLNREIKRRTRVATLFPNEASLLRLVSAILSETSEEWETGKRYLPKEDS